MAGTQNSISSLLAQFLRLQKNSLEIMNGLTEATVSTNETVSIEVLDEQGLPKNANIPSYGYLKSQIDRLDNNVKALAGIGETSATVRNPDGTYSQVYKASTLKEPQRITNLAVPSTFSVKDNWFFESFLNPLLYINVNVTGQVQDLADRIVVKRIIANTETDEQKQYFDLQLKGRNDLSYDQFISLLGDNGIGYFVDEDVISLPLRTIRYIGGFSVLGYYDDTLTTTDQFGNQVQQLRRNYKLDKLAYSDTVSGVPDGKTLDIKNIITTEDGSGYQITSVNPDQSSIQVKRVSGYQPIQIGSNVLTISSSEFGARNVQVNVGYNERQGVFFKGINDDFNIVSAVWSTGIIFWSSELRTKNSNGDVVTLENYYLNEVSDFGKIFLGAAKEKPIPAIQGLTPEAPLVTADSFKVVQINKQVTQSVSSQTISGKLNAKTSLKSEISALDTAINDAQAQLNTGLGQTTVTSNSSGTSQNKSIAANTATSPPGVNSDSVKANLNNLINEKTKKVQLYSSLVEEVSTLTKDVPQVITAPKYRVRGFWPIPGAKEDLNTGSQSVIQFSVRYRYLSDSGTAQPSDQIEFVDNNGQKKSASFSNWTEYKTDIRKKVYDTDKGIYVWADEITSDSNVQNINQLDISITKGERVEIQIASISEAGWPSNPLASGYSESVIVSFPDDLSVNGIGDVVLKNNQDVAVVEVQKSLDALGLPIHLSQQFSENGKTYVHDATSISSGFYNSSGLVVNLFDKIQEMQNQIFLLTAQLNNAKGVLEVYLVDSTNNKIKISKGSLVNINAGYYSDLFVNPLASDAGKIASFTYNVQLYNAQASLVELASLIPGGLAVKSPSTIAPNTYPVGYDDNLRYGDCPISITSLNLSDTSIVDNTYFRQAPPFASASAFSQYIYPRFKSVGYDQDLYTGGVTNSSSFTSIYDTDYAYDGAIAGTINFGISGTYPQNGTIMIPYEPAATPAIVSGATASNIWIGTFSGSTGGTPNGGGVISEFCVDKDHPYLVSIGESYSFVNYADLAKPYADNTKIYPPFRHTQTFWGDTTLDYYWVQQSYRVPSQFATGATASRDDRMYADKLGFTANDEYLIGKFSCGAYLYLGPTTPSSVQVDGSTSLSTRAIADGETNAINIPLIFQFRAVDKSGYIGGFRKSGTLSNITYTKKLGIDIQVKNEDIFSFDVQISGSYKNDTLVAPNFDSGTTS